MSEPLWSAGTMQADPRHLTVLAVGPVCRAAQGEYLECETSLGRVAIWGSERSRWNIGVVQSEDLPFEAVMFCVPGTNETHAYWVPEDTKLFFPAL
ncbi:hypothetical protein [Deinococcus alpinitundrae]|uniref:hypothetical protein n=1 Tax=Deinococcus alpinitundrae TaxID=468913 RepID=UPI00137AEB98|nr:hypothetical protein [Deinococcus alpinitundrae]